MSTIRTLTGITTSGTPHLGNYVGAIKPAIQDSLNPGISAYYFMADYHAIIKTRDPQRVHESSLQVAATWLACGLDTDRVTFYRQSDIPEIMELCWVLNCMTAKGLMNRAHAYKAAVDANVAEGNDADQAITMGLFSYPVLMAADILMFNAHKVPVGRDQVQHLEMARDIADRMNHHYKVGFTLPEAVVGENVAVLQGLDGRKMSKSYDNTIPLFEPENKLRKSINKIKTNLLEPGEPKDPDDSTLFQIWKAFADESQIDYMRREFENGIAWGEAKKQLFELVNEELKGPRARYEALMKDPGYVEAELIKGAVKAREQATPFMERVRRAMGIRPLA
ncbi:tryptophan--tRNA ligase [Aestuariirhabdus litorea]|uniref:Tryptophan--tRNA ligase n=1 Tax=Aestuariirhabdus litorea TaxID=2528527 RepID=A0A3P3VJE7_9GAMM|nr:tryptophan--tRNA ligase [Aestuariirhabdus litorea]RRJ82494.1 tryptophan--tRNA ligase [Aestuariirhabdus litorea]RWW92655.1 tryptophan--tRNA ligase [Endozoicomonadaceae bacterium GTF-13]